MFLFGLFFFYVFIFFFFFFFFQAEDGIRDRDVTGVQTCALPICCSRIREQLRPADRPWIQIQVDEVRRGARRVGDRRVDVVPLAAAYRPRSEERRVGKECRSWGRAGASKVKKEKCKWERDDEKNR